MASRDISKLQPDLREKAERLQSYFGSSLLIYCTGRSAEEQSRLYRQSRSWATIKRKIDILEKYGHIELAKILNDVGPQHGPHVTKAGPGESWHQYWLAFDCVPVVGGKLCWDVRKYQDQWKTLGSAGTDLGLNWGGNWPKWADYPHFQLPPTGNPLKLGIEGCIYREIDL